MEAEADPVVHRYIPDSALVARAQRHLRQGETHRDRFMRQRWEEATGANRVALAALREIFPSEIEGLSLHERKLIGDALEHVTQAFVALDDLTERMIGITMQRVLLGDYDSDYLDQLGVPGDQA